MLQTISSTKNILIVDSERMDCNRLARQFPGDKYTLTVAENADQAAACMASHHFDAAFIEVDLPRTRSFNLLRKIRKESPMTKVIMMTDYGDEELWVDVLSEGASDLVAKPVALKDVEGRL